jgi:hypothetical protein
MNGVPKVTIRPGGPSDRAEGFPRASATTFPPWLWATMWQRQPCF